MSSSVDLFGEIPVTLSEVSLWLYKVPRLPRFSAHRREYIRQYSVIDKIRAAKRRGDLHKAIPDACCAWCGRELDPEQPDISPADLPIPPKKNPAL